MVDYKRREEYLKGNDKGQIVFANHKLEFLRFFDKHKKLCDEMSGLKEHYIDDNNRIRINKTNFGISLNLLGAFISDFRHYIDDKFTDDNIMSEYNNLVNDFNEDKDYENYINKKDNININQEIDFTKKYLHYLVKSFKISNKMSKSLQKSINIASKEVTKSIHFVDYDGFFNNLSKYRDETSQDLSNIRYETIYDNYKKLLGYYYTYNYLINEKINKNLLKYLDLLFDYIVSDVAVKNIILLKQGADITKTKKNMIKGDFLLIKELFNELYVTINYGLKEKNILPSTKKEILVDNTLI